MSFDVRRKLWLGAGVAALATAAAASAFGGSTARGGELSGELSGAALGIAASGACSKADATEAVRSGGVADPSVADPVLKVLCGAFTGPGSRAMIASLAGPGNTGMIDWAVFRWAGGAWKLVMKQHQAAVLTAAGSDVRETVSIFREGDPRCCPSGGTKARTWHWDDARLTAGAWKQAKPATASVGSFQYGYFRTPSGNIQCDYGYGGSGRVYVRCGVRSGLRPVTRKGPDCRPDVWVVLTGNGSASAEGSSCGKDEPDSGPFAPADAGRVVGYGETWSGGGLRCTSEIAGLTCRNNSGRGFFVSRTHWRSF